MEEVNKEKKMLNMFELSDEISSLIANGKINAVVGKKIKEKIKERGISLTKEQLYKLVDKININLKNISSTTTESLQQSPINDNLLNTLENLHKRVETLEKAQTEWMKNWSEYMKKMGSNEPVERVTVTSPQQSQQSVQQQTMNFYPLSSIPNDPESIVVVMKWLQYLVDRVGKSRVSDVLNYYVDVGWITEEAKMKLLEYCEGINGKDGETPVTSLIAKDHIQSLLFIQKLMGSNVDEYFISRIEREIAKLTKNLENLSIH